MLQNEVCSINLTSSTLRILYIPYFMGVLKSVIQQFFTKLRMLEYKSVNLSPLIQFISVHK